MKDHSLTAHEIGVILHANGLHPHVKDINLYGISNGGDDYLVYTGELPDVYIRKEVPMDAFEFRETAGYLAVAMNRVNAQYTPVRVTAGEGTISFLLCAGTESAGAFADALPERLAQIERAVDQLGQALDCIIREDEQADLAEVAEQLSNPSADSPWLRGQKLS